MYQSVASLLSRFPLSKSLLIVTNNQNSLNRLIRYPIAKDLKLKLMSLKMKVKCKYDPNQPRTKKWSDFWQQKTDPKYKPG